MMDFRGIYIPTVATPAGEYEYRAYLLVYLYKAFVMLPKRSYILYDPVRSPIGSDLIGPVYTVLAYTVGCF